MTQFTQPLIGGLMIGLSASLLLLSLGRVAGISGILGRVLGGGPANRWRWVFLGGLPLGALIVRGVVGEVPVEITASPTLLVVGGLLVGFGTRLGNGCTSGHGVCGIARGSARSIAATLTFMTSAAIVVFLVRHVL